MAVPINNLECYKGEDFFPAWILNAAVSADITSWTIVLTIKLIDSGVVLSTIAATIDGSAPTRNFHVTIPAATTAAMTVGTYRYDVWRTNAGFAWVLSEGTFKIKPERRVQTP